MCGRGVRGLFGAVSIGGQTFRKIRNRTEYGELVRFLEHPIVSASLELDKVGEDERPGPRVYVSISAAARDPL